MDREVAGNGSPTDKLRSSFKSLRIICHLQETHSAVLMSSFPSIFNFFTPQI
jgi:hypothetical protein